MAPISTPPTRAASAMTMSPGVSSAKPRISKPQATFDTVAGANAAIIRGDRGRRGGERRGDRGRRGAEKRGGRSPSSFRPHRYGMTVGADGDQNDFRLRHFDPF